MVKIELSRGVWLESDKLSWTLYEYKRARGGKKYKTNQEYYTTLKGALKGAIDKILRKSRATTKYELVDELNEIIKLIQDMYDKITKLW